MKNIEFKMCILKTGVNCIDVVLHGNEHCLPIMNDKGLSSTPKQYQIFSNSADVNVDHKGFKYGHLCEVQRLMSGLKY